MSSRNRRQDLSSSDDEEEEFDNKNRRKPTQTVKAPAKNINEALKAALLEASNPGEGDEEPEVLPAPPTMVDPSKLPEPNSSQTDTTMESHTSSLEEGEIREDIITPPSTTAVASVANRPISSSSGHRYASTSNAVPSTMDDDDDQEEDASLTKTNVTIPASLQNNPLPLNNMRERAKYIPVRLSYEERKTLRLICASISVSDYTNMVDIPFKNKAKRQHVQLQQIVAVLSGIITASNYDYAKGLLEDRDFSIHERLIQSSLEICRRYKVTNPEKLRSEYGKLIYFMQDAVSTTLQPLLGVNVYTEMKTVYDLLEKGRCLALLDDPNLLIATEEILPDRNKNRAMIQQQIKRKEKAAETIVRKYMNAHISADMIRQCLYSISDQHSFLNSNQKPVQDCLALLKEYFSPDLLSVQDSKYNLGIKEGEKGARLSHTHSMQYNYVLQSLTLWSSILEDMFRLWYLAEQDLLDTNTVYELKQTGQGLQRVQSSPRVFKAMHEILAYNQRSLGGSGGSGWVGTSIIHLGDHNVPNALVFIDKYTQVARILGPLITTLNNLENLVIENPRLEAYLRSYGGIKTAKKDILHDFFTHAFDGSGGDNFFDAGSCIDGRLTSAWNWCSQLANKPYYPLFKLTGFTSFDGEFDK